MAKNYDVAVIGAGVFGSWIARMLRRSGASVVLIDQHGPANPRASSGGESRIIRMCYGADEIYTRAAQRSMELWKEVFEQEPALFTRTGVLLTAAGGDPYLVKAHLTLTKCGVNHDALNHAALRRNFPQFTFDEGTIGIHEPDSGVILARRAVQAVAGPDVVTAQVSAPADISARTVVFACGPWLPALFPDVIGPRIQPSRQEVFFFGRPPADRSQLPVWIDFGEGAYSVPAMDGRGFKLAVDTHGPPIDPETADRAFTPEKLAEVRAVLDRRFPALRGAPLLESRVCQYENTSNGDFLIDRHPHFENVWLVGGGSGHGFKHGPFVGEYVASQIAGTAPAEPRFSLATKATHRARTVY